DFHVTGVQTCALPILHVGALGWNGFLTFGVIYWLIPRIFKTELYSSKLANWHFWIGTLGIIFYAVPMYWAGFMQSLAWKEFTPRSEERRVGKECRSRW